MEIDDGNVALYRGERGALHALLPTGTSSSSSSPAGSPVLCAS